MAFKKVTVPVPADTVQSAPVEAVLKLQPGIIRWWFVGFPPGSADLLRAVVHRFEHQILPEAEGEFLYWGGHLWVIEDDYKLVDEPYEVLVRAWNLDDSYEHKLLVGAVVLSEPEVTAEGLLQRLLHALVGA